MQLNIIKKTYPLSRAHSRGYIPNIKGFFDFLPTNTKLNIYQDNPDNVLALLVFFQYFSLLDLKIY